MPFPRSLCCWLVLVAAQAHAQSGVLDGSFNFDGAGADAPVRSVVVHPAGGYLITGSFAHYNGFPRPGIAKLRPDGTLDPAFLPEVDVVAPQTRPALLEDGRVVTEAVGQAPRLLRLLPDGSIDTTFQSPFGGGYSTFTIVPDAEGKLYVGGSFGLYWGGGVGLPPNRLLRLEADGALDTGYVTGTGIQGLTGWVSCILVQPDGRVLVGGGFSGYSGLPYSGIVRLLPDGAVDTTFVCSGVGSLGDGANVADMALLPDGRIMLVGGFAEVNGQPSRGIARLMPDGTLDPSFHPGTGFDAPGNPGNPIRAWLYGLALLPDGGVFAGGSFSTYNGHPMQHLIKLLPDGSIDPDFQPGLGPDAPVRTLASDGDLLVVGGDFTSYNGTACSGILRLRVEACTVLHLLTEGPQTSCGLQDVQLDGSTTLHAEEHVGADVYRFTFIAPDGTGLGAVSFTSTTPQLIMDQTVGLLPGQAYTVTVQAFAGASPLTCFGDDTCTVAIAGNVGTGVPSHSMEQGLWAWPVPVMGDILNLRWEATEGPVWIELIDPMGRTVHTVRSSTVGSTDLALPMDRAWANGLYTVQVRTSAGPLRRLVVVQR